MKPKVIKTEDEYEMALQYLGSLMEEDETAALNDEIELFSTLIKTYEDEHYPMELPDPIEAILFMMDQQDLKRKDLIPIIGSQSKVSEVLNRKRPLSLTMIRNLHQELHISAEILLQDMKRTEI